MIYVCEYDGSVEKRDLIECGKKLDFWNQKFDAIKDCVTGQFDGAGDGMSGQIPSSAEGAGLQNGLSGRRWEKLRQRLTAWKLLETAVRREWRLSGIEELGVERTPAGKPYSSTHPKLYFNLSHCDTACACILSETEAGIDVERPFSYKPSLAKAVCTDQEWKFLCSLEEKERERTLRLLWSMKESYVKLDGRGLSYGMKEVELFSLLPHKFAPPQEPCPENTCPPLSPQISRQLSVSPAGPAVHFLTAQTARYTLAACAPALPNQIIHYPESELWNQ